MISWLRLWLPATFEKNRRQISSSKKKKKVLTYKVLGPVVLLCHVLGLLLVRLASIENQYVSKVNERGIEDQISFEVKGVERYQGRVMHALSISPGLDQYCQTRTSHLVRLIQVLKCLKLARHLLLYPKSDAHAHFNEIRFAMAKWSQHEAHKYHLGAGYSGPWLENEFINHFERMYDDKIDGNTFCMTDLFGPYIPIFIPWTDIWVNNGYQYPPGLWVTLRKVLRSDVPYIVLVQNAEGLLAKITDFSLDDIPNVLVMSSGGFGHVPVPLLKQTEAELVKKEPSERTYFSSYVGSRTHAPRDLRETWIQNLQETSLLANAKSLKGGNSLKLFTYANGSDWRQYMAESCFSFCPRGFGRTSYHVVETWQMGLLPIHVFSDTPWIPYEKLILGEQLAIVVSFQNAASLLDSMIHFWNQSRLPDNSNNYPFSASEILWSFDRIKAIEGRIVELRDSHFTVSGVLDQIQKFMHNENSDLQCRDLPESVRDETQ